MKAFWVIDRNIDQKGLPGILTSSHSSTTTTKKQIKLMIKGWDGGGVLELKSNTLGIEAREPKFNSCNLHEKLNGVMCL